MTESNLLTDLSELAKELGRLTGGYDASDTVSEAHDIIKALKQRVAFLEGYSLELIASNEMIKRDLQQRVGELEAAQINDASLKKLLDGKDQMIAAFQLRSAGLKHWLKRMTGWSDEQIEEALGEEPGEDGE